ncbi:hypothetical protein KSP39_PZI005489 [Platanthera zijinensis]|uniref:FHA domain-containing protein n=1 Tax=Platanthera zijinensis TaxID=2320716 RepID=A0AAP0BRP6_9ASPA
MQTYSIVLGRNSKRADVDVDVDLVNLGGGTNISRRHARIFYDFSRRRFSLEVFGKNGCLVEGVLHVPGTAPIKLDSQDLLQIGDMKFYFLLPNRSALASSFFLRRQIGFPGQPPTLISRREECVFDRRNRNVEGDMEERLAGEDEEEAGAKRIGRDAGSVRRATAKIVVFKKSDQAGPGRARSGSDFSQTGLDPGSIRAGTGSGSLQKREPD